LRNNVVAGTAYNIASFDTGEHSFGGGLDFRIVRPQRKRRRPLHPAYQRRRSNIHEFYSTREHKRVSLVNDKIKNTRKTSIAFYIDIPLYFFDERTAFNRANINAFTRPKKQRDLYVAQFCRGIRRHNNRGGVTRPPHIHSDDFEGI
jgi:hypothetical protein